MIWFLNFQKLQACFSWSFFWSRGRSITTWIQFCLFLTISNQKTAFFVRKGRKSCHLCPGAFTSDLAYYYHHFRSHRPKSEILDCKVCGKTAKNMMMFKRHVLGWDFSKKLTASLYLGTIHIIRQHLWGGRGGVRKCQFLLILSTKNMLT